MNKPLSESSDFDFSKGKNIIGVTSFLFECDGIDYHIPLFDFDTKNSIHNTEIQNELLKEYPDNAIFQISTKKGYHYIVFAKSTFKDYIDVLLRLFKKGLICKNFVAFTIEDLHSTLRISAKYDNYDLKFVNQIQAMNREIYDINTISHLKLYCSILNRCSLFSDIIHSVKNDISESPTFKLYHIPDKW